MVLEQAVSGGSGEFAKVRHSKEIDRARREWKPVAAPVPAQQAVGEGWGGRDWVSSRRTRSRGGRSTRQTGGSSLRDPCSRVDIRFPGPHPHHPMPQGGQAGGGGGGGRFPHPNAQRGPHPYPQQAQPQDSSDHHHTSTVARKAGRWAAAWGQSVFVDVGPGGHEGW